MAKRRRRYKHGYDKPWFQREMGGMPHWASILVLLVLAGMALLVFWERTQSETMAVPALSVAPSTTPSVTASASAEPDADRVVVVSDSYTAGSTMDSGDEARWPALIDVDAFARSGVGYVQGGSQGFLSLAEQIPGDASTVLFFGSINDTFSGYQEVRSRAEEAFAVAEENAPDAELIVVGPPWVNADPSDALLTVRDAVSDAAAAVGATWVDPIFEEWFVDSPELIGTDGIHPTDEGHEYLAERMSDILAEA